MKTSFLLRAVSLSWRGKKGKNNVLNNEITGTEPNKFSSEKFSRCKNSVSHDNIDDGDDDDNSFPELKKFRSKHPKNI